jgi:hypothetical protein
MRNLIVILAVISIFVMGASLQAAPLFTDTVNNHWAYEALSTLTAKGLIEGYPNGTFKGERALTRWEMALALSRLLAKQELESANFLSKDELEAVRKLAEECKLELEAFGVQIADLEKKLPNLEERTASLEKIKFYGSLDTLGVFQGVDGPGSRIPPYVLTPQRDWFSGVILPTGSGLTGLGTLGVKGTPSEKYQIGAEFAAFFSQGDEMVNMLWGVTAPYQSNPFTSMFAVNSIGQDISGEQGLNHQPWTKMTLDNFWLQDIEQKHKLTLGSFRPANLTKLILTPISNPNFNLPADLPFYGIQYQGKFSDKLSAEVLYSRLPQALENFTVNNTNISRSYNSWLSGIDISYQMKLGTLGLHYLRTVNEDLNNDNPHIQGVMPLPFTITDDAGTRANLVQWHDPSGTVRTAVVPQSQDSYALTLKGKLSSIAAYALEGAKTHYRPDTSRALYSDYTRDGDAYHLEVTANLKKLSLSGEYLSVSPYFDPFMLRYPVLTGNVNLPPYASYFSNYYQLHDSQLYPNNREGFRLKAKYPFTKAELSLVYESLTQKENTPGTAGNTQNGNAGFIEPLFLLASPTKGKVNDYSAVLNYNLSTKWLLGANYTHYNLARKTVKGFNDYLDLNIDLTTLGLGYKLNEKLNLIGNYSWFNFTGDYGSAPQKFRQYIPALGVNYALDTNTNCSLMYRIFTYNDLITAGQGWNGRQLMLELKTKF